MTDPTVEEEVRRMKNGSRSLFVGIMVGIALTLVLGMLFLPFLTQPGVTETLPKILEPAPQPAPAPAPAETPDSMPRIDLSLPSNMPEGADLTAAQTVIVAHVSMNDGEVTVGSGVLWTDGVVVTAAHLHRQPINDTRIGIYCSGSAVEGQLIDQDEDRDISVIAAPGCTGYGLHLSRHAIKAETPLFISGFSFAFDGRRTWAKRFFERTFHVPGAQPDPEQLEGAAAELVSVMRKHDIPPLQALRGVCLPGQSGSPVFLENGDLVGVLIMRYPRYGQSFMVPAESIDTVLRHARLLR